MRTTRQAVRRLAAPQTFVAVVDTNVCVDATSASDLEREYNRWVVILPQAAWQQAQVVERLARVRGAILLAAYFNECRAATYGAHEELIRTLTACAPPAPGGRSLASDFMQFSVHFIKDELLPDWDHRVPSRPEKITGTPMDRELIARAKEWGVPLISNEGRDAFGVVSEAKSGNMRKRARKEGVEVFTPEQFLHMREVDEDAIGIRFLERLDSRVSDHMAARRRKFGYEAGAEEFVRWIASYYEAALNYPQLTCKPRRLYLPSSTHLLAILSQAAA